MNLPNVFQNRNINIDNNQQDLFYGNEIIKKETTSSNNKDIKNTLKKLFASKNYVYKLDVVIETKKNTMKTTIIGQTNNHLITLDNQLIPISEIVDIYEKKEK